MKTMKEIISSFIQDSKYGKRKSLKWFLSNVMEEEAERQRGIPFYY
jgi:hypothetical protein